MAEPSTFQTVVAVANGVLSILACLLLIGLAVGSLALWRGVARAKHQLALVQRDVAPLLATLGRVATNLEAATSTVRSDIEAIHATVTDANEVARSVVHTAEDRLRRLGSVVGAAQEEVEGALVDVAATARGVRAGASVLRGILGLADAGTGPVARPRGGRAAVPKAGGRGAEPIERGEFEDAGDRRRDSGNGRGRPRARSHRHQG